MLKKYIGRQRKQQEKNIEEKKKELFEEEQQLIKEIFEKWSDNKPYADKQLIVRMLFNNIELLEMFNKDPKKVEDEIEKINKQKKINLQQFKQFLKKDDEYEQLMEEYLKKEFESIKEENNIGLLQQKEIDLIRNSINYLDKEGELMVNIQELIAEIIERSGKEINLMNKPGVLITSFKQVLSIGYILELMNSIYQQQKIISLKEFQNFFIKFNSNIIKRKYFDEIEMDQLIFKYNFVDLKEQNRIIYEKLVTIFMNEYVYDKMWVDKIRLIKSIQEEMWDYMQDVVVTIDKNLIYSLEDIIIKLINDERQFITRDIFFSFFSHYYLITNQQCNQVNPSLQQQILQQFQLYIPIQQNHFQIQQKREKSYEKISLDRLSSDSEDHIIRINKINRKKQQILTNQQQREANIIKLNPNCTNTHYYQFKLTQSSHNTIACKKNQKDAIEKKNALQKEEDDALNYKIHIRSVPQQVKDKSLYSDIKEYKSKRKEEKFKQLEQEKDMNQFKFYERHMKEKNEKEIQLKEEKEKNENLVIPFKASHVAYTSKYQMYWEMKEKEEEERRERRRKREEWMLANSKELGGLKKRMQADQKRFDSNIEKVRQQNIQDMQFSNHIQFKPIPDYQKQWQLFAEKMETQKQLYKQQQEYKFKHLKPIELTSSKLIVPVKQELDQINQQIKNQFRPQTNSNNQILYLQHTIQPIRYTKKFEALVENKKMQRQQEIQREEQVLREQQFKMFRKMIFAPRVWNSQALQFPKYQNDQQQCSQQSNNYNQVLDNRIQNNVQQLKNQQKFNTKTYNKMMEEMIERVQQRPLMMEEYRMDYNINNNYHHNEEEVKQIQVQEDKNEINNNFSQQLDNQNISEIKNQSQMENIQEQVNEDEDYQVQDYKKKKQKNNKIEEEFQNEIKVDDQEIDNMDNHLIKDNSESNNYINNNIDNNDNNENNLEGDEINYDDDQLESHSNNHPDNKNIEEEALQRMQILANMSNLENMDEQQLYEHYEFLKKHGYINDDDVNNPNQQNINQDQEDEFHQQTNTYYESNKKHHYNNSL